MTFRDPLGPRPQRVLAAGTSAADDRTLAARITPVLDIACPQIDAPDARIEVGAAKACDSISPLLAARSTHVPDRPCPAGVGGVVW
jgi:hypothetical protein